MNILITRSSLENKLLANRINSFFEQNNQQKERLNDDNNQQKPQLNFVSIPLFKYKILSKYNKKDKIILISSLFIAKYLARQIEHKTYCFVVGDKSVEILKMNKNIKIILIAENMSTLIKKIATLSPDTRKRIVYYRGKKISQPMPPNLKIREKIIYDACYIKKLKSKDYAKIRSNKLDIIVSYSRLNAFNLIKILLKAKLFSSIKNVHALTLSPNIAKIFIKHKITATPAKQIKEISLLESLYEIARKEAQ